MPEQPNDPIHYDMKIPPEPQDSSIQKQRQGENAEQRGSDEVTSESNDLERTGTSPEDARRHLPGGPARQP